MIIFGPKIDPGRINPLTYVITKNEEGRLEMCQYMYLRFNDHSLPGKTYEIIATAPTKEKGLNALREIVEKSAYRYH